MKHNAICSMDVREDTEFTIEHKGTKYYFCSAGCRDTFVNRQLDLNWC